MRILNIKREEESTMAHTTPIQQRTSTFLDDDERYPCWYADLETGDDRKDFRWKVGCKYRDQIDEYKFRISRAGDINDNDIWNKLVGADFAIELINKFKTEGAAGVKKWVKSGCPLGSVI